MFLAALSWAGGVAAEPGGRLVAVLHEPGREAEAGELARAIGIQASDLPVRIEVRAAGGTEAKQATEEVIIDEARAACGPSTCLAAVSWTDLPDGRTLLQVVDPADGRVLTREVSAEDRAARFETMALICRGTLALLLEGGRIGVAPAAPPLNAVVPPPPRHLEERRPPLAIGLGYAFASRSAEAPVMHGMDLSAGVRVSPRLHLGASYTVFAPADIVGRQAEIRLRRHPLSLGVDLLFREGGSRWQPGGGLALFIDPVLQETRRLDDPAAVPRDNLDALFGLSVSLPLAFRISDHLSLLARVSADFYFNNINYLYDNTLYDNLGSAGLSGNGVETLEKPWRVQPRAHLGLLISLP